MSSNKDTINNIFKGVRSKIQKTFNNPYKKANLSWFDVKKLKHDSSKNLKTHTLFGKKTYYYNPYEYLHALEEIVIEEVYLQDLPKNANIIDCGSHIGISIIYLKKICPTASIIGFEPDKSNFNLLSQNIKSHELSNVTILNEAVWKTDGYLNFESNSNMASKLVPNEIIDTSKQVKATRLKNLLDKKIDFLKIDIEGAEYEVLLDIADNLHFVDKLFIEYHGSYAQNNELIKIFEIINKNGFGFYIKEATSVLDNPFNRNTEPKKLYDLQLNIFCTK